MSRRLGSIDLGSSSLHLWIVDLEEQGPETVHLERAGLQLVRSWPTDGPRIDPQVATETLDVIAAMVERCRDMGCDHIQIAATAAVREAREHHSTCDQILERTGVEVRVLSGSEEARISFLGVLPRLDLSRGPALVFDLGGGSTELALGDSQGPRWLSSLPLGHLRCTQALAPLPDPYGPQTTARLKALVATSLGPSLAPLATHPWDRLVGVSGTVWTVSRVIEGHFGRPQPLGRAAAQIKLAELVALRQHLELLPRSDLANLQGMDRRRKDSFFTGLVIVEGLLEGLNCEVLWTAEGGVREGLVADFNRQHAT